MHIQLTKGMATVSMTQFLKELLDDYGHVRVYNTPATSRLFNATAAEEFDDAEKKKFHTVVAKLLYFSKRTRADILTVVAYLRTREQSALTTNTKKERIFVFAFNADCSQRVGRTKQCMRSLPLLYAAVLTSVADERSG